MDTGNTYTWVSVHCRQEAHKLVEKLVLTNAPRTRQNRLGQAQPAGHSAMPP
jgi:hypothetical protein